MAIGKDHLYTSNLTPESDDYCTVNVKTVAFVLSPVDSIGQVVDVSVSEPPWCKYTCCLSWFIYKQSHTWIRWLLHCKFENCCICIIPVDSIGKVVDVSVGSHDLHIDIYS